MITAVCGLGNPGSEYEETRHNIGFMVLELLASRRGAVWRSEKKCNALIAQTQFGAPEGPGFRVWLIKPLTYMNNSGESVRSFFEWHKSGASSLLVVADDFALPLGQIRTRPSGGCGGHNGLLSIEKHLHTSSFARLRCGIGPVPEHRDTADWVLRPFAKEELGTVNRMVDRAASAVEVACSLGLTVAMNEYNKADSTTGGTTRVA